MRGFGNTKEFGEFVAEVEQQLDTAEGKFQLLHIQCKDCMEEIL